MWLLLVALGLAEEPRGQRFPVPPIDEDWLCDWADWVVIARVVEKEGYADSRLGRWVSTWVTVATEAVAAGEPPPRFTFSIAGGSLGNVRVTTTLAPDLDVGGRYLLLMHRDAQSPGSDLREQLGVALAYALNRQGDLPSDAVLSLVWQEHCGVGTLAAAERPSQYVLGYLPPELLEWCEHY